MGSATMPQLVFATSNAHKTEEVAAILGETWQVEDLRAHPAVTLDEETGDTFEANAIIKATSGSRQLPGLLVLADDSGLEVDALGGAPGVYSARYAGVKASAADNREKLKQELAKLPQGGPFPARFQCCIVLARDGFVLHKAQASVEGRVIASEEGEGGFGYDPLFIPEGHGATFGTLPPTVKNELSHRARALEALKEEMSLHLT